MEIVNNEQGLEIIQLESEDGILVDCIRLADIEYENNIYTALRVLQDVEENIIALFRVEEENEDEDALVGLEEGPEFEAIKEKFNQVFEQTMPGYRTEE